MYHPRIVWWATFNSLDQPLIDVGLYLPHTTKASRWPFIDFSWVWWHPPKTQAWCIGQYFLEHPISVEATFPGWCTHAMKFLCSYFFFIYKHHLPSFANHLAALVEQRWPSGPTHPSICEYQPINCTKSSCHPHISLLHPLELCVSTHKLCEQPMQSMGDYLTLSNKVWVLHPFSAPIFLDFHGFSCHFPSICFNFINISSILALFRLIFVYFHRFWL